MKVNKTLLLEFIFDLMSQNEVTVKEFTVAFFRSRVRNQEYQEAFIRGLEEELKKIHIIDSRDLHDDLFENLK